MFFYQKLVCRFNEEFFFWIAHKLTGKLTERYSSFLMDILCLHRYNKKQHLMDFPIMNETYHKVQFKRSTRSGCLCFALKFISFCLQKRAQVEGRPITELLTGVAEM